MYERLRPWLFRTDPEWAHNRTLDLLSIVGLTGLGRRLIRRAFPVPRAVRRVRAMGLEFANPLGLAAGYDKDGRAMHGLASLGFGHLELGTVTPAPQAGNPQPRLFRLPQDEALINRMGFPSAGAEVLARRLARGRPAGTVVGVNIGKGADTPLERAAEDYCWLLRRFYGLADYLSINVSSPNTPGLRRLQMRDLLESLLRALADERRGCAARVGRHLPLLVKLAPDLTDEELEQAVGAVADAGLEGVIATNTTLDRSGLRSAARGEVGGLSGAPLRQRSTEVIRRLARWADGKLVIVGVGGILSARDAREKLEAGATLVQVYTGLVYRGPGLVRGILVGLGAQE
ncbi:MAG: quinone-dependent dihydroorotate dehydrogenase [Chloroflexota bacterium]